MKNSYILFVLLALTLSVGVLSGVIDKRSSIIWAVLGISSIKFLLVAFQFMELRKAHAFWKCLIVGYVVAISSALCLILS